MSMQAVCLTSSLAHNLLSHGSLQCLSVLRPPKSLFMANTFTSKTHVWNHDY